MRRWQVFGAVLVVGVLVAPGVAGAVDRARVRRPGPVRVLLIGDSNTQRYAPYAVSTLQARGYEVDVEGNRSTGLLDAWMCADGAVRNRFLQKYDPDVVVAEYVGNFGLFPPCKTLEWGSPQWFTQWQRAARSFERVLSRRGARFSWVAMPPLLDDPYSTVTPRVNDIYRVLGPTIETWSTTTYSMPGEPHLNAEGNRMLAGDVVDVVDGEAG